MLEHIVRNNETVYDILTIYNVSMQELREHNLHITDFNNLHSGTKLKIPFINDSVNQILGSTESFVEDYYSKISEEMLNEIEGINFDNNINIKNESIKEIEPLIRENNKGSIPKGIPYPGIVPPRKNHGRIR